MIQSLHSHCPNVVNKRNYHQDHNHNLPSLNKPLPSCKLVTKATQSDDDKTNAKKADFSAYWSLKINNFFKKRQQFLDEKKRELDRESDVQRLLRMRQEQDEKESMQRLMKEEKMRIQREQEQMSRKLAKSGDADIRFMTSEFNKAKDFVYSPQMAIMVAIAKATYLLKTVILSPVSLCVSFMASWNALFQSQRYENFLMAEGERIWYWRNRTENERWFWEVFFWDRLVWPIVCTVTYEYIVPNNFFWAVVIPLALIFYQDGKLPSLMSAELWLITYFGFYQKCWPDFLQLLKTVFVWA